MHAFHRPGNGLKKVKQEDLKSLRLDSAEGESNPDPRAHVDPFMVCTVPLGAPTHPP